MFVMYIRYVCKKMTSRGCESCLESISAFIDRQLASRSSKAERGSLVSHQLIDPRHHNILVFCFGNSKYVLVSTILIVSSCLTDIDGSSV